MSEYLTGVPGKVVLGEPGDGVVGARWRITMIHHCDHGSVVSCSQWCMAECRCRSKHDPDRRHVHCQNCGAISCHGQWWRFKAPVNVYNAMHTGDHRTPLVPELVSRPQKMTTLGTAIIEFTETLRPLLRELDRHLLQLDRTHLRDEDDDEEQPQVRRIRELVGRVRTSHGGVLRLLQLDPDDELWRDA